MTKAFVINSKNVSKQRDLRTIRARPRGAEQHSTSTKGKRSRKQTKDSDTQTQYVLLTSLVIYLYSSSIVVNICFIFRCTSRL